MNKKQRNRKIVKQTKRNRIINRRYNTSIKGLFKLLKKKISLNFQEITQDTKEKDELKKEIVLISNNLTSIIDKACKKSVIHKNNAARKKSRMSRILKVL
jgi:small subunit ribosomal protein S20